MGLFVKASNRRKMLSNKFTKDTFENFSKTKVSSLKVFAPILLDSCEYD